MKARPYFMELQHIYTDERVLEHLKKSKLKDSMLAFFQYIKENNVNPMDVILLSEEHLSVLSSANTVITKFDEIKDSGEEHYGVAQLVYNLQEIEKNALVEFASLIKEYTHPVAFIRLQTYLWVNYLDFIAYMREKLGIEDSPLEKDELIYWTTTFMSMSMEVAHFYSELVKGLTLKDLEELEQMEDLLGNSKNGNKQSSTFH